MIIIDIHQMLLFLRRFTQPHRAKKTLGRQRLRDPQQQRGPRIAMDHDLTYKKQ